MKKTQTAIDVLEKLFLQDAPDERLVDVAVDDVVKELLEDDYWAGMAEITFDEARGQRQKAVWRLAEVLKAEFTAKIFPIWVWRQIAGRLLDESGITPLGGGR